jgi:hypothetical protein
MMWSRMQSTLTTAVEAAETVVAKYGMTIVSNKVPRFELRKADDAVESPSKRIRHFSAVDAHAAAARQSVLPLLPLLKLLHLLKLLALLKVLALLKLLPSMPTLWQSVLQPLPLLKLLPLLQTLPLLKQLPLLKLLLKLLALLKPLLKQLLKPQPKSHCSAAALAAAACAQRYLTMNEEALFLNCCSSFFCLDVALSAAAAAATAATAILVAVFSASWCNRLRVSAAIRSVAKVMLSNISQYTIHSNIKMLGCTPGKISVSSFVVTKLVLQRKMHKIMILPTVFLTP